MPRSIADAGRRAQEIEALARTVVAQFEQYIKLNKKIPPEVLVSINQIEDPGEARRHGRLAPDAQDPREAGAARDRDGRERLERVFGFMEGEIGVLQVEKRIRNRVKRQMEKTQREYYLNEQLKAIQKELGEGEEGRDELAELEERIKKTKLSQGSAREGDGGAEEAALDEPDVGRGDGGAQLPRLDAVDPVEEAHQGQARHQARREGPQRRPFRPREGQGAHPRIPRRAAAHQAR